MDLDLKRAVEQLHRGTDTCVLCRGQTVYTSAARGVAPLLGFLDSGTDLRGYAAADRVVGNGAAFLYVLLQVKAVYAGVISQPASETLEKYGIPVTWGTRVPAIQNRTHTGPCPIEQAVAGADTPERALSAIRQRLRQLRAQSE